MKYSLKTRQICLFFIAFLPVIKFFLMPSNVAKFAWEDMWISLIVNVLVDFGTLAVIVIVTKNEKRNIFEILEDSIGKIPSKIFLFFYLIYFMLKGIMPISEQKDYVDFTLYLSSSSIVFFLPFFIIPVYLSIKKLRVVGRCADAVWIFAVIGYLLIFALSIGNIDLNAILPVGATGVKNILKGSYSALNWFGDCAYFLFFIGNYKHEKNDTRKILISYGISLFIVFIFGFFFWCSFSSIAFRQRFALTEISKYMTVINNIGRFDYFAIFFLLFSAVFSTSLPIYFSSLIFNRVFGIKKAYVAPLLLTGVNLTVNLFFSQNFYTLERFLTLKIGIVYFAFGNLFPIIISLLSRLKRKENKYEIQEN